MWGALILTNHGTTMVIVRRCRSFTVSWEWEHSAISNDWQAIDSCAHPHLLSLQTLPLHKLTSLCPILLPNTSQEMAVSHDMLVVFFVMFYWNTVLICYECSSVTRTENWKSDPSTSHRHQQSETQRRMQSFPFPSIIWSVFCLQFRLFHLQAVLSRIPHSFNVTGCQLDQPQGYHVAIHCESMAVAIQIEVALLPTDSITKSKFAPSWCETLLSTGGIEHMSLLKLFQTNSYSKWWGSCRQLSYFQN